MNANFDQLIGSIRSLHAILVTNRRFLGCKFDDMEIAILEDEIGNIEEEIYRLKTRLTLLRGLSAGGP